MAKQATIPSVFVRHGSANIYISESSCGESHEIFHGKSDEDDDEMNI